MIFCRSDFYNEAMAQQGLAACGPACWDPLTNRSFGAVLLGSHVHSVNGTALGTQGVLPPGFPVEFVLAVASAQTPTAGAFEQLMRGVEEGARSRIGSV